ncbi:MAG: hypothetical protein GSR80_001750 [Desulfurococcales archaeon]|nr:hypothetical protein [Desulfurococcales archaeon]
MAGEIRVKSRHPLSKKEKRRLLPLLRKILAEADDTKLEIARVEAHGRIYEILIAGGEPAALLVGDGLEPLLYFLVRNRSAAESLPRVVVDRGASKAVTRGANLMLPGIRAVEGSFDVGDLVVIVDEPTGMPVAVGRALLPSSEVVESVGTGRKGVAVKVTQRPGDALWRACEALSTR